ncbi:DUF4269 domain-containing protein [Thalassobacillus sp. CUG 92003]|uniref:DUF4269 domain-containing protein n=1 Tax=Thalassobacillus sp. CUG 92003 TaxID=2736641 RepID=UPI003519E8B5
MISRLGSLRAGDVKQVDAWHTIQRLNIMNDLAEHSPVLCGTIPLGIYTEHSDLDIILEVHDFPAFTNKVRHLYQHLQQFNLKEKWIRNERVIKVNFTVEGWMVELFGQNKAVSHQYAFLHMIVEEELLTRYPHIKETIIHLKQQGHTTEAAFCEVLGLRGDPYEALLKFGKDDGIIHVP